MLFQRVEAKRDNWFVSYFFHIYVVFSFFYFCKLRLLSTFIKLLITISRVVTCLLFRSAKRKYQPYNYVPFIDHHDFILKRDDFLKFCFIWYVSSATDCLKGLLSECYQNEAHFSKPNIKYFVQKQPSAYKIALFESIYCQHTEKWHESC